MLFTSVHFHFFQGCTELEDEELQDSPKQVSAEVTDFFMVFLFTHLNMFSDILQLPPS